MKKIETIEEMLAFLKTSREGERAEYFRGFLLDNRQDALFYNANREKIKVTDIAFEAYENSLCTLTQKKHGYGDYSYYIDSYGTGKLVLR